MNDKSNFSKKLESFVNGKGFYIVLFSCIAVIGVSAWVLAFSGNTDDAFGEEDYAAVMAGTEDMTVQESGGDTPEDEEQQVSVNLAPEISTSQETMNPIEVPEESEETETAEPETEEKQPEAPAEKSDGEDTASQTTQEAEDENVLQKDDSAQTFMWPVNGEIEVDYSPESLIYSKTMADWRIHCGIDIASEMGTRVMAASAGTVQSVETDDLLGTVVKIDHGNGIVSVYANLAATPTVSAGDSVTAGSVIGSVGDTALSETGEVSHLHFEMTKDGETVDPTDYLP